jgi:prepilin-type N-terminal cleavage/methylation domain-containing protein
MNMKHSKPTDNKPLAKGFSLIEMMVVVAIIATISALSLIAYNTYWVKARDNKRLSDITQIQNVLSSYFSNEKKYPDAITFGGSLSEASTTYMIGIFTNPSPRNDGACADQEYTYGTTTDLYGQEDFFINFCLGGPLNGISSGNQCLTSQGIQSGSCSNYSLKTGLVLWLKADGNVKAPGSQSLVGTWFDESGNSNNAVQNASTSQPVYNAGPPASVVFDGSNDIMQTSNIALQANFTILTAYISTKTGTSTYLYGGWNSDGYKSYYTEGDNNGGNCTVGLSSDAGASVTFTKSSTVGTPTIVTNEVVGSTYSQYLNGVSLGAGQSFSGLFTLYNIGGAYDSNFYLKGKILEMIVYNRALSTAERIAAENYLSKKYSIAVTH